ncbi:hypothetical protein [Flammeovirga sp. SJP92]|uniref:hypothetical protein n=1 Tax=Flammeovirga sp. SJP92 TaxID=1775430 RepID=UPI00078841C1|nr:hypothetical protein [Flammeovirga sp. SJP92]KXX70615.1 hypothetical protein AVL50_07275 [Flammeovirga sp. SJP92]
MKKGRKFEFKSRKKGVIGRVVIGYRETGELQTMEVTLKSKGKYLQEEAMEMLFNALPKTLKKVEACQYFQVKELSPDKALNTRTFNYISDWTRIYLEMIGIKYKMSKKEAGMLMLVETTDDEIKMYLESSEWNMQGKTVTEFCRPEIQNTLKRLVAQLKNGTKEPAIVPDAQLESNLEGKALQEYWRKLRNAGYRLDKSGGKRNWVKGAPENKAPPKQPQASGEQEEKVQQQMNVLANKFRTV